MPTHPFPAQNACPLSFPDLIYADPEIEKSLNELSSLTTANCRLI